MWELTHGSRWEGLQHRAAPPTAPTDKYSLGPRFGDLFIYMFTSNLQTLCLFALISVIRQTARTPHSITISVDVFSIHCSAQLLGPRAPEQQTLFRWQIPDHPWAEEPPVGAGPALPPGPSSQPSFCCQMGSFIWATVNGFAFGAGLGGDVSGGRGGGKGRGGSLEKLRSGRCSRLIRIQIWSQLSSENLTFILKIILETLLLFLIINNTISVVSNYYYQGFPKKKKKRRPIGQSTVAFPPQNVCLTAT